MVSLSLLILETMGKFYFNLAKYIFVRASESQSFINKTILRLRTSISTVYITGVEEASVYAVTDHYF